MVCWVIFHATFDNTVLARLEKVQVLLLLAKQPRQKRDNGRTQPVYRLVGSKPIIKPVNRVVVINDTLRLSISVRTTGVGFYSNYFGCSVFCHRMSGVVIRWLF